MLIRQKILKILLFLKNSYEAQDARFKFLEKRGKDEIATLAFSKLAMTEGLKLTIFTYKWGKCVKPVGKYLLESLI
jgi:hypothetical protein